MLDIRTPRWFAAYTKPKNEKKVLERLTAIGIEAYLPLQKKLKQWSDRKKVIEEPIIRSYIFVRIVEQDFYKVLNTFGVIKYITFEGKAVPIPDKQIEVLKQLLEQNFTIEAVEEKLQPGEMVEIRMGSLMGLTGELIEHNGSKKVIIRIDHVSHSLLVTLPKEYVAKAIKF